MQKACQCLALLSTAWQCLALLSTSGLVSGGARGAMAPPKFQDLLNKYIFFRNADEAPDLLSLRKKMLILDMKQLDAAIQQNACSFAFIQYYFILSLMNDLVLWLNYYFFLCQKYVCKYNIKDAFKTMGVFFILVTRTVS